MHSSHESLKNGETCLSIKSVTVNDICLHLLSSSKDGTRHVIPVMLRKPFLIGRSPKCDYVVNELVVSAVHCKIYVYQKGAQEINVSCLDTSTNGILINGHKIRKSWALLADGDNLAIPHSQSFIVRFREIYTRAKTHLFDPTPPSVPAVKCIGKYKVTSHCLGRGTFASVNLAVELGAYRQVACKTTRPRSEGTADTRMWRTVMKEVNILKSLSHPNINKVYDVLVNESWLHIFLELACGGDLFTYITSGGHPHHRLNEGEARYITYQLLKGLCYMHSLHVSHRDLKTGPNTSIQPENVLLHDPGPFPRVTIADFGLARQKAYQATYNAVGTVPYMPPEAINALTVPGAKYVGMPADCWSLGCCIYSMLSGAHPFDREPDNSGFSHTETQREIREESKIKSRIVDGPLNFYEEVWDGLISAKSLISSLLIPDPHARCTVQKAFDNEWIRAHKTELLDLYDRKVGHKM